MVGNLQRYKWAENKWGHETRNAWTQILQEDTHEVQQTSSTCEIFLFRLEILELEKATWETSFLTDQFRAILLYITSLAASLL